MAALYYFAAWADSGCPLGCDHEHPTVVSAVVCAQSASAGAYVIAVERRELRELNDSEEQEFQLAMYGAKTEKPKLARFELLKPVLN